MPEVYEGVDFYDSDFLLTDEERSIRDMVREWVEREYVPIIRKHVQAGTFPTEVIPQLGEMGLLGANLPEKYGCAAVSEVAYGLINQELERGDSGLRSFSSVQSGLVMYPIFAYGSEEQKSYWLPKLATGEKIGCFGLTEPDHGSDPGSMITRAEDKGDHYLVHGAKMWITNSPMADVFIVWAKLDGVVRGFILEKGMKGLTAPEMTGKLSLWASATGEIVMDHVEVPKANILPNTQGLKGPLSCLTQARYGIAFGATGAAMACFDEVRKYSKSRIQFGKPIGTFQLTQAKLADMVTEITAMQLLQIQLGRLKEHGVMKPHHVSLAKRNNVVKALEIARSARTILGANGILDEYVSMRHAANLESVLTYEGTHEIHTLVLGEWVTGIAAYA
ncbi:MAG: acyl-CoA dehydrogenase family protein [bacterium]|nr:acyl-CoA dehydrogenase family protein [bacterium]